SQAAGGEAGDDQLVDEEEAEEEGRQRPAEDEVAPIAAVPGARGPGGRALGHGPHLGRRNLTSPSRAEMSVTDNQAIPAGIDRPSALLDWIDAEMERLAARLPALEQAALKAVEELAEADVIRRHVILH